MTGFARDLFEAVESVEDASPNVGTVELVTVEPDRGHILLHIDQLGQYVAFADLGPRLHLWTAQGAYLTPTHVRELGLALVAWADRKEPQ